MFNSLIIICVCLALVIVGISFTIYWYYKKSKQKDIKMTKHKKRLFIILPNLLGILLIIFLIALGLQINEIWFKR